jgi:ribulose-bisphosphate carboxylase large chain
MSVDRVDEMVATYGRDSMLLIGGGLLTARDKLSEKAREFVRKVRDARV